MALVIEDGTGLANANAYVDPTGEAAADYLAGNLYASAWDAADAPTREKAVRMATRTLDNGVVWYGVRTYPDRQRLAWPRNGMVRECTQLPSNAIPHEIVDATMELALYLLTRDRTNTDGAISAEVSKIGLGEGALDIEFTGGTDPAAKPVSVLPDSVWRMVQGFGDRVGAAFNMARVRR